MRGLNSSISFWVLGLLWLGQANAAAMGSPRSAQACDATCSQCTDTEGGGSRCCLEGCGYGCDDTSVVWDECIKAGCCATCVDCEGTEYSGGRSGPSKITEQGPFNASVRFPDLIAGRQREVELPGPEVECERREEGRGELRAHDADFAGRLGQGGLGVVREVAVVEETGPVRGSAQARLSVLESVGPEVQAAAGVGETRVEEGDGQDGVVGADGPEAEGVVFGGRAGEELFDEQGWHEYHETNVLPPANTTRGNGVGAARKPQKVMAAANGPPFEGVELGESTRGTLKTEKELSQVILQSSSKF
ncbi:hypothetical protein PG997_000647 [Apiospora hydei]|uniref:Uncharacterized protein n=1 Tax=Apiospora hydei TaxID=1337664 RepID=A0ABR1XBK4_9PEZI